MNSKDEVHGQGLLKLQQSDFFPDVDRASQEKTKELFWQPAIAGLIGLGVPFIVKDDVFKKRNDEKEPEVTLEKQKNAKNPVYQQLDGLFVGGDDMGSQAINKNRIEQIMLADEKYQYFDDEADLLVDNEFFEEKIQRLYAIDYEDNTCLQTYQRPATRCSRLNQSKQMPFRLDIYIGVLQFTYHPLFSKQDQNLSDLKYLIKKYRQRADLALIPHFKRTMLILQNELAELKNRADNPEKEIDIIEKEMERVHNKLDDEKAELQKIMSQLYDKWGQIKEERNSSKFNSQYKLGVRQYQSIDNTDEIEFMLLKQEEEGDQQIGSQEEAKRNEVREFEVSIEIVINNSVVATTTKKKLQWPGFDARFMERLQVYVFTKPASIKLRIYRVSFFSKLIDEIEVEIPGEKSNSITSSGFIMKEAYFAKGRDEIRLQRYKNLVQDSNNKGTEISEIEEYEGFISYRTEWPEYGPKMPPDPLDMQYSELQNKFEDELGSKEEKLEQDPEYFDINDPRNENVVQKIQRQQGREELDTQYDCVVPYYREKSLRQQLLRLRNFKPELAEIYIPMLDQEIQMNNELMQFINDEEQEQNYQRELRNQQKGQIQILDDYITDPQTQKRLLEIQSILNQRKLEKKGNSDSAAGLLTLENVVSEFHFEAAASLLAQCIKSVFKKKRRLGKEEKSIMDKKNLTQISVVTVSILIVQANNVPIRSDAFDPLYNARKRFEENQNVKEIIDQLYQVKKVKPVLQLALELDAERIDIIKEEIHEKEKEKKNIPGPQSQIAFGFDQKDDIPETELFMKRISKGKRQDLFSSESEGCNPEWNELVEFKIGKLGKDQNSQVFFDPKDVINSRNKLIITLYDQIGGIRQVSNDVNSYNVNFQRSYIGQVTIPLLNLFQQETISGTFRISRPLMLLNYRTLNIDQLFNNQKGNQQNPSLINIVDPHIPTTIEMTLTLDPTIKLNDDNGQFNYFPGAESTNLFLYGIKQITKYKRHWPTRNVRFWAENLKGESVFLSRFLKPLSPPQMDLGTNAIEKAARYVSLIPFKNDTETFQDLPDIFCNCQEFVDLRAGDFEEHAILLCCFFLHIDGVENPKFKSYVIIGRGLPEGNTLYVMRKAVNSNYVQVWNPQTAECFVFQNQQVFKRLFCFTVSSGFQNLNDVDDEACPLKQIFCVFDQHNVYVNIQQSDSPSEISFNIEDQNLWEPFLTQDQLTTFYPKGQVSIQSEIQFDPADPERAKLVQEQLERFIEDRIQDYRKSKIDKLKGPFTTMFSKQRYAQMSSYIRDIILQNLEGFKYRIRQSGMAKMQGVNGEQNEEQVQLNQDQDNEVVWDYQESLKYIYQQQQELMKKKQQYKISKQIYGFPLNFTFIDNEKAWDEVKATGIADITSDELEFLCIVKCFPYPHYIISTWVFVAVLYQQ